MRVLVSGILAALIVFMVHGCVEADDLKKKTNIYHQESTVVSIGQCDGGKCGVSVRSKNTGEVVFATLSQPAAIGQTVYQMCWTEKARGNMCYVNYSTQKEMP